MYSIDNSLGDVLREGPSPTPLPAGPRGPVVLQCCWSAGPAIKLVLAIDAKKKKDKVWTNHGRELIGTNWWIQPIRKK